MWKRETKTDEQIYTEIAQEMIRTFEERSPACGDATSFVADEIFKAKFDSEKGVHCFFSPSKSNGWVTCPAYLDRAKKWEGSNEPAIRGTIVHHFLSRAIEYLKSKKNFVELDFISHIVFQNPEWLSVPGVNSALELIKKVIELGIDETQSEVFILSPTLGIPNKNLRFGGSIDVLHIKEHESNDKRIWAHIHIYDLKTGKNIVHPNSWQLKCYALLVRDFLLEVKPYLSHLIFTLGIAQDGKISEYEFSDEQIQSSEFVKIKRAMNCYDKVYIGNRLNVEINDELDSGFPECFNPCSYCRFCRGCYKAGLL